jgi:hypothetical protein
MNDDEYYQHDMEYHDWVEHRARAKEAEGEDGRRWQPMATVVGMILLLAFCMILAGIIVAARNASL